MCDIVSYLLIVVSRKYQENIKWYNTVGVLYTLDNRVVEFYNVCLILTNLSLQIFGCIR